MRGWPRAATWSVRAAAHCSRHPTAWCDSRTTPGRAGPGTAPVASGCCTSRRSKSGERSRDPRPCAPGTMGPVLVGPNAVSVQGTATDADTSDAVAISVFIDGRVAVSTGAAPNFGASVAVPADGAHRMCVTADDDLGQSRPVLGCQDFTITSVPFGSLDTASPVGASGAATSTVVGWAIDPRPATRSRWTCTSTARSRCARPPTNRGPMWPRRGRVYGPNHGFSATVTVEGPSRTPCARTASSTTTNRSRTRLHHPSDAPRILL